jgi:electron transport complex protein RnfB
MSEDVYKKLARVLDTLPNGFPATDDGLEIKLLKKIFEPDEAELFCDLRLEFETAKQIAERSGRPLEGLEEKLKRMRERGQLFGVRFGDTWLFKMLPWVFGIFEFQLGRLDRELAELTEKYHPVFGKQFFSTTPQMMQTLPIEEEIKSEQQALPYEKVSQLIEKSKSFGVRECICKKEKALLGQPCDRPLEVCLVLAPIPGVFDDSPVDRVITREEAYKLLRECEENALVHLTGNVQHGRIYICNCCGCCCGVLRGINELGIPASSVVNSHYVAVIDEDECTACGVCAEKRCQVNAIEERDDTYQVIADRCIGCGLCISDCPVEAIRLEKRPTEELVPPPVDEKQWNRERGEKRGVDYSKYE